MLVARVVFLGDSIELIFFSKNSLCLNMCFILITPRVDISTRVYPTSISSAVFLSLPSTSTAETCAVVLLRPTKGALEYY